MAPDQPNDKNEAGDNTFLFSQAQKLPISETFAEDIAGWMNADQPQEIADDMFVDIIKKTWIEKQWWWKWCLPEENDSFWMSKFDCNNYWIHWAARQFWWH